MPNLEGTVPPNHRVPLLRTVQSSKLRNQLTLVSLVNKLRHGLFSSLLFPQPRDKPALDNSTRAISPVKAFKPGHKRTMPAPEPEPEPSFHSLKPARSKAPPNHPTVLGTKANTELTVDVQNKGEGFLEPEPFSSGTLGSKSLCGSMVSDDVLVLSTGGSGSLPPVFKHIRDSEVLKRASLFTADDKGKHNSDVCSREPDDQSLTVPLAREVRKALGGSGTLGSSDMSGYSKSQLDASDPDTDVPDELKFILAAHSDRGPLWKKTKILQWRLLLLNWPQLMIPIWSRTLKNFLFSVSHSPTMTKPVSRSTVRAHTAPRTIQRSLTLFLSECRECHG